jgi:hypothetical protein
LLRITFRFPEAVVWYVRHRRNTIIGCFVPADAV